MSCTWPEMSKGHIPQVTPAVPSFTTLRDAEMAKLATFDRAINPVSAHISLLASFPLTRCYGKLTQRFGALGAR